MYICRQGLSSAEAGGSEAARALLSRDCASDPVLETRQTISKTLREKTHGNRKAISSRERARGRSARGWCSLEDTTQCVKSLRPSCTRLYPHLHSCRRKRLLQDKFNAGNLCRMKLEHTRLSKLDFGLGLSHFQHENTRQHSSCSLLLSRGALDSHRLCTTWKP